MELYKYHRHDSGILLRLGEQFLPFMEPVYSLQRNPYMLGAQGLNNEFQNILHALTQSLLNGDLLQRRIKGLLLFKKVPNITFMEIQRLIPAFESLYEHNISDRLKDIARYITTKESLLFKDACAVIADLYQLWSDLPNDTSDIKLHKVAVKEISNELYKAKELKYVLCLKQLVEEKMSPYITGYYLHGSLATMDYTEFSDTDDVIILKKDVLRNPESCSEFLKASIEIAASFYDFDPYQHHRHIIITEWDLDVYSQAYLPVKVFEHGISICGASNLLFAVRDSKFDHRSYLWKVIQWFRRRWIDSKCEITSIWNLKYYVATILFIPVLFLEALGTIVYKRDSFELAREYFSEDDWKVVIWASTLRSSWSKKLRFRESVAHKIIMKALMRPLLFEYYMSRQKLNYNALKEMDAFNTSEFISASIRFIESVASKMSLQEERERIPRGS